MLSIQIVGQIRFFVLNPSFRYVLKCINLSFRKQGKTDPSFLEKRIYTVLEYTRSFVPRTYQNTFFHPTSCVFQGFGMFQNTSNLFFQGFGMFQEARQNTIFLFGTSKSHCFGDARFFVVEISQNSFCSLNQPLFLEFFAWRGRNFDGNYANQILLHAPTLDLLLFTCV